VWTGTPVQAVEHRAARWCLRTPRGEFRAPVLVNAAGAWGDTLADAAGVRRLGLEPLRRTIISFDPPEGLDVRGWPLVRSLADEFYFLPEGGRLLASPADATPSPPCDAQPEEYDVALAAWRVEQVTTMTVRQMLHKWAGLRTFTADKVPVAGFAPEAPGYFWLAGQGGYGLQTAPALAEVTEALVTGTPWPRALALEPGDLAPARLLPGDPAPARLLPG
jgi:D-arginine dehydrogenase